MFEQAYAYYKKAKWLHRIYFIIGLLLGMYMYYHAYSHLNNNISGSIPILMLSGSLFIATGILDLTKNSLTTSLLSALSAIIAFVLYLFH
ncbi:hypothetical protein C6497_03660 [Candidatus Poribacteria bacterium]|nr:MAG: hypothetical protein C6497_03660 [Candidatus Poribacteria bacterium]